MVESSDMICKHFSQSFIPNFSCKYLENFVIFICHGMRVIRIKPVLAQVVPVVVSFFCLGGEYYLTTGSVTLGPRLLELRKDEGFGGYLLKE